MTTKNVPRYYQVSSRRQNHCQLRATSLESKYFSLKRFPHSTRVPLFILSLSHRWTRSSCKVGSVGLHISLEQFFIQCVSCACMGSCLWWMCTMLLHSCLEEGFLVMCRREQSMVRLRKGEKAVEPQTPRIIVCKLQTLLLCPSAKTRHK